MAIKYDVKVVSVPDDIKTPEELEAFMKPFALQGWYPQQVGAFKNKESVIFYKQITV